MTSNTPAAVANRKILRLPQVKERTGLGHDSIYRLGRQGVFPRPVKIGVQASGWLESEVEAYLARCQAERDARPQGTQPQPPRAARSRARRRDRL